MEHRMEQDKHVLNLVTITNQEEEVTLRTDDLNTHRFVTQDMMNI